MDVRRLFARARGHLNVRANLTGIAIGTLGGFLLSLLQFPLAWMIGALAISMLAAGIGMDIAIAKPLRDVMIAVLGVLLGSRFSLELFTSAHDLSWSIGGLALYVTIATLIGTLFLLRVSKLDFASAYFSAAPGGMIEMTVVGEHFGGNSMAITIGHTIRIITVACFIPLAVVALVDTDIALPASRAAHAPPVTTLELALLAACLIAGPLTARLRVPAAWMVGPMVCSAALHAAGWVHIAPPTSVVAAAQVVLGTFLGSSFRQLDVRAVVRIGGAAAVLTFILVLVALICSLVLHALSGLPILDLFLAYAPGGFTEMSLIALVVGGDVGFVAVHHILRVSGIVALAPFAFRVLPKSFGHKTTRPTE